MNLCVWPIGSQSKQVVQLCSLPYSPESGLFLIQPRQCLTAGGLLRMHLHVFECSQVDKICII